MSNLYYYPVIESEGTLPIGFFSPPKITPDNSLAILSTERYVIQNQSEFYTYLYSPSGLNVIQANSSVEYSGTVINSEVVGGFSIGSNSLNIKDGSVEFNWLNSPITFVGVNQSQDEGFHPLISTGMVWRFHQVSENEPEWSWLKKAGLQAGEEVFLGYSVPEAFYDSTNITDPTNFHTSRTTTWVEDISPIGPHLLKFTRNLKYLNSITINGTEYSENIPYYESSSLVRSIDLDSKIITLKRSLDPTDKVTINYEVYTDLYKYTGYKFVDENNDISWKTLDLNPSYGREIADQVTESIKPASVALFNQVLLYLIPVCFCKLQFSSTGPADSAILNGTLTFDSAFNYNETHFVRHYIGETNEVFDTSLGLSSSDFYNYWGITPFGQASYDEIGPGLLVDDIFSNFLPSMMPIGKILLAGPGAITSINSVDLRRRGGGIPENYSIPALKGSGNEDNLRNLWDFGNWPGKLYHTGGSFTVTLAKSILDTHTQEEIEKLVDFYTPPGVNAIIEYTE